jgi:hypothetical protein
MPLKENGGEQVPDDEQFNEFIRQHAADYRAGGPPPADEIWDRIEPDVADAIGAARRSGRRTRLWLVAGAALAAAMVVGVGIGRWIGPRTPGSRDAGHLVATRADSVRRIEHLRTTAYDHLGETELFLTEVRADMRVGRGNTERSERSRELLARTRLLLQSREQQSPSVTRLLEDLELLLAEIAALPDSGQQPSAADATLLEETLTRNDILPRIRTTVPAQAAGT